MILLFIPNNNIETKKKFPDNRHFLIINPSTGKIVYSKIITNIYNILPYFNIKGFFLYGMQASLHDDIITGRNKTRMHNKYLKKIFINNLKTETVKMNKKILDIYISDFDNWNIAFINENSFYIMSKYDIDRSKEFENIPFKEADAKSKYDFNLYKVDIDKGEIIYLDSMKSHIKNAFLNSNKGLRIMGEEIAISRAQYLSKKKLLLFQIYRRFIAKSRRYRRIKKSDSYTFIYNINSKKISFIKYDGDIKNGDLLGVYNNVLYYWRIGREHEIIGIKLNDEEYNFIKV